MMQEEILEKKKVPPLWFDITLLRGFAIAFPREGGGTTAIFSEPPCKHGKTEVKLVARGLHLKG